MNSKTFNIKAFLKGIGYLVLYIILPSLISIPFSSLLNKNNLTYNLITLLINLLTTIIFIIIFYKTIKKDFKSLNLNKFKKAFLYWLFGAILMIVSSTIISLIGIPLPSNETTNRTQFDLYPIIQIISSILFIPIIEELIFRLSFKDLSSNKHIYAIFTGLFFAIMHLPDAFTNPIMLIHLIPYASVGIAFGYIYKNTDNIIPSITSHSLHNLLTILQLFIIGG